MELIKVSKQPSTIDTEAEVIPNDDASTNEVQKVQRAFIEANTIPCSFEEMKKSHIIPSFAKDGEALISHTDFIEAVAEEANQVFGGEQINDPVIRLSHEIQGRIPSAKNKPAKELLPHERTLYYERMMFVIEVPSIRGNIGGNDLTLTIGGVKSYSEDNLYGRAGTEQHFKLFIGFENKVCTNMCISTDGLLGNIAIKNLDQLKMYTRLLIEKFNYNFLLTSLNCMENYELSERQFATLIGRCRMYNHLPKAVQNKIPPMMFGESQVGAVVRDYYKSDSFSRNGNGSINLWRLYNLFTSANKSSYIDSFANKAVNAFSFTYGLKIALDEKEENWFLN